MKKAIREFVFDLFSLVGLWDAAVRSKRGVWDAPPKSELSSAKIDLVVLPPDGIPDGVTLLKVVFHDKEAGPHYSGPDINKLTSYYDVN